MFCETADNHVLKIGLERLSSLSYHNWLVICKISSSISEDGDADIVMYFGNAHKISQLAITNLLCSSYRIISS